MDGPGTTGEVIIERNGRQPRGLCEVLSVFRACGRSRVWGVFVWAAIVFSTLVLPSSAFASDVPATSPFDEVPARTWPYAVVDYFSERGLVEGFPGGLYDAGRSLTRYEMGLIASTIFERIGRQGKRDLTAGELDWLRRLAREYEPELALLGYYQQSLADGDETGEADSGDVRLQLRTRLEGLQHERTAIGRYPLVGAGQPAPGAAVSATSPLAARGGPGSTSAAGSSSEEGLRILVGARASLGVVERSEDPADNVRNASLGFAPLGGGRRSYDLVVDLGDLRITTGPDDFDRYRRGVIGSSFDVNVVTPGGISLSATGPTSYGEEAGSVRTVTLPRARLDMDFTVPQGRLRMGWRYETGFDNPILGTQTVASLEYQLDSRAQAVAGIALEDSEASRTRTTALGLRYSLGGGGSLLLGYRLIDFTDLRESEREGIQSNMATAEFSIRF